MRSEEINGALTPAEQIAVDYADIVEQLVKLNKSLISELAQYRIMDEEERELQELIERTGGGRKCGNQ